MIMKKKKLSLSIIVLVSIVLAFAYILKVNLDLRRELELSHADSVKQIQELEEKLSKSDREKSPAPATKKTSITTDENELIKGLFPEIAALEEKSEENDGSSRPEYLVIEPEIFDFGNIKKSDGEVTATYQLKNQGDKTITLSYAFASCGCTASSLKDEVELVPGASYPLQVIYDPNFYGPAFELGPITKTVTVLSNDPVKPFYKVSLKANVSP